MLRCLGNCNGRMVVIYPIGRTNCERVEDENAAEAEYQVVLWRDLLNYSVTTART